MEPLQVEQVALYDVQKILECIRVKAWSSIPLYAKHLSVLATVKTIQQEREMYGRSIIYIKKGF